jgi:PAS domain S-box-containing protein
MRIDDDLPLMLWTARPDLSCDYVSPAWLAFTGLAREQALGHGWSRALHPEDLARWLDACVRAFDAREPFSLEYRLRRRDGEYRWLLDRAAPRGQDGVFLGFAGVCIDIDEARRAQRELARSLERERRLRIAAEQSGRMQQRLIAKLLPLCQPGHAALPHALEEPLLAGVRVLVVEDDAPARELPVKVLRVAGAETRAAASSSEALEMLGAWHPDIVLSDLGMRGDEGYVLIRAVAAGYDAQLAKPVEPMALLATVARLVQPVSL